MKRKKKTTKNWSNISAMRNELLKSRKWGLNLTYKLYIYIDIHFYTTNIVLIFFSYVSFFIDSFLIFVALLVSFLVLYFSFFLLIFNHHPIRSLNRWSCRVHANTYYFFFFCFFLPSASLVSSYRWHVVFHF